MSDQSTPAPAPYVRPNLNRPKVAQMTQGVSFFDRDAYGRYLLALKNFRFEPGKKNNPHYRADVVVLEAHATKSVATETSPEVYAVGPSELYTPGKVTALYFATGRAGTATNPGRPDFDDAYLAAFVRAVSRVPRGAAFDAEKGLDELIAAGKVDHDLAQFWFDRRPEPKKQKIKDPRDPSGKTILQEIDRVFSKDFFDAVTTAPVVG